MPPHSLGSWTQDPMRSPFRQCSRQLVMHAQAMTGLKYAARAAQGSTYRAHVASGDGPGCVALCILHRP